MAAATAALAGFSVALRAGSVIANLGTLDSREQASLVTGEREQRALSRQISEINIQTDRLAGERLASLQRDLGSIAANAAALGVTGGASVATSQATTAASAGQAQARTVSQATRTIRNLHERKTALEEARKQERKNMRIGAITGAVQEAASALTVEGQQLIESTK